MQLDHRDDGAATDAARDGRTDPRGGRGPGAVQLTRRFDERRLVADWEALARVNPRAQPGPYHRGGWRGLSLIAPGGLATWAGACLPVGLPPAKTPLLKQTPYLEEVLDALPCTIESARLLMLAPGETIQPHRDELMDLRTGIARLHVPIVTHPDVRFVVGGARYVLEPGTLWYGAFSRLHSVANPSNVERVHLVMDAIVNDRLLRLFPAAYLDGLPSRQLFLPPDSLSPSALRLPARARRFGVPQTLRAHVVAFRKFANAALAGTRFTESGTRFVNAARPSEDEGRTLSFGQVDGAPVLNVDDEPYAVLSALSSTSFRMFGFLPCITGSLEGDGLRVFYKDRLIGRCGSLVA